MDKETERGREIDRETEGERERKKKVTTKQNIVWGKDKRVQWWNVTTEQHPSIIKGEREKSNINLGPIPHIWSAPQTNSFSKICFWVRLSKIL